MSMSDEGTVTDEVRIRELEQALETETDRLRGSTPPTSSKRRSWLTPRQKSKSSRRKSSTVRSKKRPWTTS